VTLTKFITRKDTALTVIFLMFAIQSVIGAIPAYLTWEWPAPHNWLSVAVIALAGTGSHYCLSKAISLADATIVMPMDFLRLPLTALLGYVIYAEGLDIWSVTGALLILAANTLNLFKASKT
jgi:drug/metabolite transporter (DMT)-like permease